MKILGFFLMMALFSWSSAFASDCVLGDRFERKDLAKAIAEELQVESATILDSSTRIRDWVVAWGSDSVTRAMRLQVVANGVASTYRDCTVDYFPTDDVIGVPEFVAIAGCKPEGSGINYFEVAQNVQTAGIRKCPAPSADLSAAYLHSYGQQ